MRAATFYCAMLYMMLGFKAQFKGESDWKIFACIMLGFIFALLSGLGERK